LTPRSGVRGEASGRYADAARDLAAVVAEFLHGGHAGRHRTASLSPAIGGWIAQEIGYSAMFLILGSFALGSIALWLGFATTLKPACVRRYGANTGATAVFAGAH
jgi:hypothetical protein